MSCRTLIISYLILLVVPLAWARTRSELERSLRNEYKDKVLTQRRFLSGAQLTYAEDGTSQNSAIGPWTTDAELRVTAVSLPDEHTIQIQGERLFLVHVGHGDFRDIQTDLKRQKALDKKQLADLQEQRKVVVHIKSSGAWDEPKARAALAKVFLGKDERLSAFVPEYWRSFFQREGEAQPGNETIWLPPVASGAPVSPPALRVGGAVSAPRAIVTPDPAYADVARRSKYQGTSVLAIIVGVDGIPRDIQITRALGLGLDDKAVEAVRAWRFEPAMREDKPVPVQINVEVNFRMY